MDYFGGKLVPADRQFGGSEEWNWKAEDQFQTLRAEVNALQAALSAAMRDNSPLHFNCGAGERGLKSENGKVRSRTRAGDAPWLLIKPFAVSGGRVFGQGLRMTAGFY